MPPSLSQGVSLSFNGESYTVVSVSARAPRPEIVNMNHINGQVGNMDLVWTGDYEEPGIVEAEVLAFTNPAALVGTRGNLSINSSSASVISGTGICTDATSDAKVGDLLRARLVFNFTTA